VAGSVPVGGHSRLAADVDLTYVGLDGSRCAELPEGARTSDLERLRRGPTRVSGKAMVAALDRVSEIAGLGVGPWGRFRVVGW